MVVDVMPQRQPLLQQFSPAFGIHAGKRQRRSVRQAGGKDAAEMVQQTNAGLRETVIMVCSLLVIDGRSFLPFVR